MSRKMSEDSGPSKGRLASFRASVCEMWNDFLKFIWDPAEKTVLGRGGKSWGQILIFYACYYSFLTCLFAIAISVVLGSLDPYVPTFQTRIQGPGLSIQPRFASRIALTTDIKFTAGDNTTYGKYVDQMTTFFDGYGDQSNATFFDNCTNGKVLTHQKFNGSEVASVCTFYPQQVLGDCASTDTSYGYDIGKPCILVKVNKIINWFPVGYTDLSKATGNDHSKAPPLTDVLESIGPDVTYDPYRMYISCYGWGTEDEINLNGESGKTSANTKYYGNGIPFMYYPYYGKERQPQYKTPVVAVQFTNVTRNVDVNIGCKAYAKNFVDNERMNIGYMNFNLRIDGSS